MNRNVSRHHNCFPRARVNSNRWLILLTFFLIAVLTTFRVSAEEVTPEGNLKPEQILERLQQGGLVVYIRHAATDRSHEDQHPVDLNNCETQRNLSELGRQQSKDIGAAFQRLSIPVSNVLSSPFCRCKDTASIAFGKVETNPNLYFAVALAKKDRAAQTVKLRELLTSIPDKGNRIIVSHTGNLREATGLWPKPEGVAIVLEPLGNDDYQLLGKIAPDAWNTLNP